ncbi:MAG: Gfo/Idh/MocA family oxidoreductase [Saprospiraceae bacterium]|nr:Gfo/Idh/MocA family oxidoreductase [Saprospiraceae bacterium]MDW8485242.1 Gfo/Idh/MocA family oxidoreductase [Saprospiraceae bacterium]
MKRFALIGAAGYVATRHMRAIKETANILVAALDPSDSVGIIDSYFPDAAFFTEFERFDRYVNKLARSGCPIDYVSVCSPNYLHDAHIRFGLRNDAHVICEKPVVLNPWNIDGLREIEQETGRRVYTILQLRLHPVLQELKRYVEAAPKNKVFDVNLTYITSRGRWYYASWKGNIEKSGGIATNIGIHFFDMLHWIFGEVLENRVYIHTHDRACGFLHLEKARVNWFLSINYDVLRQAFALSNGQRTFRSITVEGKEIEFSEGFTDLHTLSYQRILEGKGFTLDDAARAIEIVYQIRKAQLVELNGDYYHPLARLPLEPHPFERE